MVRVDTLAEHTSVVQNWCMQLIE